MDTATLIKELERTRDETLGYFELTDDELDRTYAPDKWSVRYLLHHLADSETVLYDRVRRVISEPRQVLWVFDENAFAKGLDYAAVPLEMSRAIYKSIRAGNIYYARLHYEKNGRLEFVHSVTGVRTLKDELDKVAAHNAHHLEQIRTALAAR
jgi:hypothetical protein